MAKYRHKIFEMFEYRDEAIIALTPHSARSDPEPSVPDTMNFKQLDVLHSNGVIHVRFKQPEIAGELTESEFRNDLTELAGKLEQNSKVLLDFANIESFSPTAIDAIVAIKQKLQIKGSRIVLCCLNPEPRASFFSG